MSTNVSETAESPEATLRTFILPIFFVILIAIILSLFTLEYYASLQENIIENNDFESGSNKWTINKTTFGPPAFSGSNSAKITPGGFIAQDLSDIQVDDNSIFTFWVYNADNASIKFIVYYTDESSTTFDFTLNDTDSWVKKNATGLPIDKIINKINITNTGDFTDIYIDNIEFYVTAEIQEIAPNPENPDDPGGIALGAILNMLFYVTLAFIGGLLVLFIIKRGFMNLLVYFFAIVMGFSWFIFGFYYGGIVSIHIINEIWSYLPDIIKIWINTYFEVFLFIFAMLLGILGLVSFGIQSFEKIWFRNLMMIFFGAMIGSMLAIHFPLLSIIFVLIGLSLYDIYAVFRGPLKGIIDHGRETAEQFEEQVVLQNEVEYERVPLLPALPVYTTPLINIGLGDFAFFSMLISTAVTISYELVTPIPIITAFIGLFVGAIYTFKFLKKDRALPGLPLPIFCGLGCLVLGLIVCLILNISSIDSIISLFVP